MFKILRNLMHNKPILTIFDVTKLCNERCPMCNIWKTKSDDMDLSQISTKAYELSQFGIGYVFIQGGEPTIRKDLIEIIDIFIANKIKPTIITNGILLTQSLAKKIGERRCNLAISIDSMDQKLFQQLRGVDALDKVLENVKLIKNIPRRGNWSITTTVSALSQQDDIDSIESFAHNHGFMHAIRPYVYVKGTAGKKVDELIGERAGIIQIFEKYLEKAKKNNVIASFIYEEHLQYLRGVPMPPCDAMKYSMLMKETGCLSPCIEFPDIDIKFEEFDLQQKKHLNVFSTCNATTPCFYNDAREIGILWRKKLRVLKKSPQIAVQLMKYGNFF